jgi:hypothetical protein
LSIRAELPRVRANGTDTISGRLLSRKTPLRNKIVVLLSRADGATTWGFVGAKHTGKQGGVAFIVKPAVSSRYRLLFQGTANFRRARSAVVHVATRPTALSITASAGHVAPGGSAIISGVLTNNTAPYAGQTVQLWGRPVAGHHKFAALTSAGSGADGSVSFTVTPTKAMRYFLYFPRTADAPAAQSTTRTIAVS